MSSNKTRFLNGVSEKVKPRKLDGAEDIEALFSKRWKQLVKKLIG
jgi:hypothetical protein